MQWYTNLPPNSIDSFSQLTDTFVDPFASNKKLEKLSGDLYRIYQYQGEPLREYVSRFNKEKVYILNCNQETVVEVFRRRLLTDGELYKTIIMLTNVTMEEALSQAVTQIRWEDDEANRLRYNPSDDC